MSLTVYNTILSSQVEREAVTLAKFLTISESLGEHEISQLIEVNAAELILPRMSLAMYNTQVSSQFSCDLNNRCDHIISNYLCSNTVILPR